MTLRTFVAAAALALAACSPQAANQAPAPAPIPVSAATATYAIDPSHTTVAIRARHFGLSNYTLRFNTVSGTLNFNAEDPAQSSVEATVAIASLDTPDQGPRDFDAELQNSQWLDADNFPSATFRSTSVDRTGPNTARVTGDLTIKGQAHPITLDVTYNASHAQHPLGFPVSLIGFSARGEIQRSQYGVTELMANSGDNDGVADTVEIVIEAEFVRPVEAAN